MGHEHPAVSIKDDLGVKHASKAFLNGKLPGSQITVLPSTSSLTIGMAMNETPSSELLSPILRNNSLGELVPYVAEVGTHVKKFPALKML